MVLTMPALEISRALNSSFVRSTGYFHYSKIVIFLFFKKYVKLFLGIFP